MPLMMVIVLGICVSLNMLVQLATLHFTVGPIVHICCNGSQMGSIMVLHHKVIRPFEAEDIQEGAPCSEVTDSTEDKAIHNAVLQRNTLAKTPVNIDALKQELEFYDSKEAEIILNGFVHGFPLNYVGPRVPSESKNLKSALARPEITQQKIDK